MKGKCILLGISGGIAAYKAAELVRCFVKAGASVQVVMTKNARQFITPLTLQTLSGQPVGSELFDEQAEARIGHIHAARTTDLMVLAPATANLIAKMAAGIADDYLTTIILATTAPLLVCPSMNVKMYQHPATQRNLATLRQLGYHVMEPESGYLACNEEGAGRLPDLPAIVETAEHLLTAPSLRGKHILVSAGPTWEFFDPVRYLSNPSSGKMGFALAAAAARRSAQVTLVSGPTSLVPPRGVDFVPVTSTAEMQAAVDGLAARMDVIVMSAAVSDYRPVEVAPQKLKKTAGELHITLTKNPDILAGLGRSKSPGQILVGFAAETENLVENATEKLARKNLDLIVANNLKQSGSGFGTDTNAVRIIDREGQATDLPCLPKMEVAELLWDRIERLLEDRAPHGTS